MATHDAVDKALESLADEPYSGPIDMDSVALLRWTAIAGGHCSLCVMVMYWVYMFVDVICDIDLDSKSVRAGTTTSPLTKKPSKMPIFLCPKCGVTKKFGARSCCARGGAWFKNCGDDGDTKFDHTWTEGIQACKGVWYTDPLFVCVMSMARAEQHCFIADHMTF